MLGWLVVAAAAVAAGAAVARGDQYEQQATRLQSGHHRFKHTPELQVGCADGAVHHDHAGPVLQVLKRLKRQAEQRRQRRDFIQWYGPTDSSTYQQPNYIQSYQIHSSVPYFVPVWGNPRRIPIFFPAKPILFNPGFAARNPPSNRPTTQQPPVNNGDGVVPSIGNRINLNKEGEYIWGIVEGEDTASSSAVGTPRPPTSTGTGSRPTRPPTPPLLHRPSITDQDNQNAQPSGVSDRDNPNIGQPSVNQEVRPPVQFRPQTTTTPRPSAAVAPQGREEPNRCVWAIISCCNPANNQISYNCFERLGCPGAFWDNNPCSRETTAAALNAAAKFYEQT